MELCRGGRDIRPKGKAFSVEFWNKTSGQTDQGLNCCNCLAVKGKVHPNMKFLFISSYYKKAV